MNDCLVGGEPDRFTVIRDSPDMITFIPVDDASVLIGTSEIGIEANCFRVVLYCAVVVTLSVTRQAPIEVTLCLVGG